MRANIAFLPMDSRPCSSDFVIKIGRIAGYDVINPPFSWYQDFMSETDEDKMSRWLTDVAANAEYLVVSIDMLLYGGLATALRFRTGLELARTRLSALRDIKAKYPRLKIYAAHELAGSSNSAYTPEELVHRSHCMTYSQLTHKIALHARPEDQNALDALMKIIDKDALDDFLKVRARGQEVCFDLVDMAAEGIIDFISFATGDCSLYGIHRTYQQALVTRIYDKAVPHKAIVYAGTDEQCQVLLARAMLNHQGKRLRFFPRYSCTGGENVVAMFEDNPIGNNLRAQIYACDCVTVDSPEDADVVLMLNTPCQSSEDYRVPMQNARHYFLPEPAHNLWDFMSAIAFYLETGRRVAIADVAFTNGCDRGLVRFLEKQVDIARLTGFSGWNTPGNTIGTVLAHCVARILYEQDETQDLRSETAHFEFLLERFADEYFYQVIVRTEVNTYVESLPDCSTLNLGERYGQIDAMVRQKLSPLVRAFFDEHFAGRRLTERFAGQAIDGMSLTIRLPWQRTFEVWADAKFSVRDAE